MNPPRPSKTFTFVVTLLFLVGCWWLAKPLVDRTGHPPVFDIANNLRILEGAKEQWALEHHQTNGALLTPADLAPYLKNGEFIKPAAGEIYTITPVGEPITARMTRECDFAEAGRAFTVTNF